MRVSRAPHSGQELLSSDSDCVPFTESQDILDGPPEVGTFAPQFGQGRFSISDILRRLEHGGALSAIPAGLIHIVCSVATRISPNALQALTDALSTMFWYKDDLRAYLVSATGLAETIASLDWTYKRRAADEFVQGLASDQDRNRDLLIRLMVDVAVVEDFPKLRGIEDEAEKIAEAKAANATLRKYIKPYEQELVDQERAQERIADARTDAQEKRAFETSLFQLKGRYEELVAMDDPQARGLALEALLRDLFVLFDLDPRSAFVLEGEQIDGSFSLGGTNFLLEAKWTARQVERKDLDAFRAKIEGRIENTLGLFVSINGFQLTAVENHSGRGARMILMTGGDLYFVLDGRVDLQRLLERKYRHASQTGEILLEASDF